jgi:hypothetical protein
MILSRKQRSLWRCALACVSGAGLFGYADPQPPEIKSIRPDGTNVVLVVHVSEGLRRVTLESRSRADREEWKTRDLSWPDGKAGDFTFVLPQTRDLEVIRLRGDDTTTLPLPAAFYKGRREFDPVSRSADTVGRGAFDSPGGAVVPGGDVASPAAPGQGADVPSRTVVESDIWQISGNTLYFFNQQRGLQVIDISNPDAPMAAGMLPLTAYGEQMYVLPAAGEAGSQYVALLANDGCRWDASQIIIVKVQGGQPSEVSRLSVPGQIKESRLVGDALYVASYSWEEVVLEEKKDGDGNVISRSVNWESHTRISSFDLSAPGAAVAKPVITLPTNPDAISATERFLLVATTGTVTPGTGQTPQPWELAGNHAVVIFDISDPAGEVHQAGVALIAGRVADKFKLNIRDDTLAVVSQVEGWTPSAHDTQTSAWSGGLWERETWLETFSISDPAAPRRLGALSLIKGESVFATRFDGDRAYVVTFRRIDPLWVVDLSDPSRPRIAGELEVPGFSTYIQPLGDRLIAMGSEGGSAAVSLFDVSDAAKPALLSRVSLGQWSWSEANYDEKAFKVITDAGLILVPWSGYVEDPATGGTYFQGMQLIDFGRDSVVRRGHIDHEFQARRASVVQDRILSISGNELLAVDAADRDHPVVKASLDLSPQVDRVWLFGEHLVKLKYGSAKAPPLLSVASVAKPETTLVSLALPQGDVAGTSKADGRLHLAQWTGGGWEQQAQLFTNVSITSEPQPPLLSYETNDVVQLVPQPPIVKLELVTVIIPLPPIPGDDRPPRFLTNEVWRPIEYPQPPLSVTNTVITKHETPQSPLIRTNETVYTNYVSVRIPANLLVSSVDLSALPGLTLRGQLKLEADTNFDGVSLEAVWPEPNLLVWTENRSSGNSPIYWLDDGIVAPGVRGAIDTLRPAGGAIFIDWWWPWWGRQTANLVALDTHEVDAPKLLSRVALGVGQEWSEFSRARAADGKVFLSHSISKYVPPEIQSEIRTNADGSTYQWWNPGTWDISHHLDVVDFADATKPVIRPPVSFPGALAGVSHVGALLYADVQANGESGAVPQLQALAYDGLGASLVASLAVPAAWPSPHLVTDEGIVVIGQPGDGKAIKPALETWALSIDARFERYGTVTVDGAVADLHLMGPLLVAGSAASGLKFYDAGQLPDLEARGDADGLCNLWFDWNSADGSLNSGLWVPRGSLGLWHVPLSP